MPSQVIYSLRSLEEDRRTLVIAVVSLVVAVTMGRFLRRIRAKIDEHQNKKFEEQKRESSSLATRFVEESLLGLTLCLLAQLSYSCLLSSRVPSRYSHDFRVRR